MDSKSLLVLMLIITIWLLVNLFACCLIRAHGKEAWLAYRCYVKPFDRRDNSFGGFCLGIFLWPGTWLIRKMWPVHWDVQTDPLTFERYKTIKKS